MDLYSSHKVLKPLKLHLSFYLEQELVPSMLVSRLASWMRRRFYHLVQKLQRLVNCTLPQMELQLSSPPIVYRFFCTLFRNWRYLVGYFREITRGLAPKRNFSSVACYVCFLIGWWPYKSCVISVNQYWCCWLTVLFYNIYFLIAFLRYSLDQSSARSLVLVMVHLALHALTTDFCDAERNLQESSCL